MSELHKLIGKKIVAVRGHRADRRSKKPVEAEYILPNDNETYIKLSAPECHAYPYHDCSSSARRIEVWKNKDKWTYIFSDLKDFPETMEDP